MLAAHDVNFMPLRFRHTAADIRRIDQVRRLRASRPGGRHQLRKPHGHFSFMLYEPALRHAACRWAAQHAPQAAGEQQLELADISRQMLLFAIQQQER